MLRKCSCLQRATILIVGLLIICCLTAIIGVTTSHGLFVPMEEQYLADPQSIVIDQPDLLSCTAVENGLLLMPRANGQAGISSGECLLMVVDCAASGFAYEHISGRYTGDLWVRCAVFIFLAGTAAILALMLRRQMKTAFYHYDTPLLTGFLLLDVLILAMLSVCLLLSRNQSLENIASSLPALLLLYMQPAIILFALAMLASNLSLLRHEGKTWRNLLGSIIGATLFLAALLIVMNSNASGSLDDIHLHDFLINLLSGLVLWTECKLAGIIICGALAARREPAMDRDYILILGCKLSRKGGLTPLLKGRVDRALGFARRQQAAAGYMPVLIPCGGQGRDELRSEAAAMCEYLQEQGVPAESIQGEDKSVNTLENIRNAQAMMKPGARVAYATTNYHVFRAGVWASRNGLQAEGMGSSTKWYYWPNAFMREYVALIAANLMHELVMIALISIQSGLLAYLYH